MENNHKTIEPLILIMQKMVQQSARERAISLRWNMASLSLTYGIIIAILLLDQNSLKFLHLFLVSTIGLIAIVVISALREKKLAKRESEFFKSLFLPLTDAKSGLRPDILQPANSSLTARELQILAHVIQGESDKEIANRMELSQYTVRNHLRSVYQKMEVKDRTSAAVLALNLGWIKLIPQEEELSSSDGKSTHFQKAG